MRLLLLAISLFFASPFASVAQTYEVEKVELYAKIQTIEGINESSSDFSPLKFGDKIYFTSSRQYNKNNTGEGNWEKNGYLNVFYGSLKKENAQLITVRDIRLLSNKIKSNNHTGPISFTSTGDTLFFTQVVQVPGEKEYKSQLFMSVKSKDKWSKIKLLPFSNRKNSFGHPCFDPVQNRLYFASDMPQGKGKKDIYYVELNNGDWSDPINLEIINTADDEMFPFVIGGNVFFSSNRSGGDGQMDIYYSAPESAEFPIKLEGLNSSFDDFGVSLLPDLSAGYFSSNRNGNDDIFYFTLERSVTMKNQLSGSFTFKHLLGSPSDITVQIYDEDGEFVYEEKIDENGNFLFDNVNVKKDFSLRFQGVDEDGAIVEFHDAEGNPIANFIVNKDGDFQYKKLLYDLGGVINFIPEDMINFSLNNALLSGKLVYENDLNTTFNNSEVNLLDSNKNVVFTTKTDSLGNFEFTNIPISNDYFIQIPKCDDELVLFIYDSEDNIFTQLKCNSSDNYFYRLLKPKVGTALDLLKESKEDIFELQNEEVIGRFESISQDTKPVSEKEVKIYDDNGDLLGTTKTDKLGNFKFVNVSNDRTLSFTIEGNDESELSLFNRYGKGIAKIQKEENDYFVFRPLGFQTESSLSLIDETNDFDFTYTEKYEALTVYFDVNKREVNKSDLTNLDKLLAIMRKNSALNLSISAYADATASSEYNFTLSQKRGEWIAQYLIKKGIEKNRLTLNAYGETKLIDPENDAVNRRAELRIYH